MDRTSFYIDGFNFYHGLRDAGWKRYYWIDFHKLARNLIKPGQELIAVKYFTSRISAPPEKQKRQSDFLDAIQSRRQIETYWGHYLTKQRRCRSCGAVNEIPEEKMTDVNIAVEVLNDAYAGRFDTAIIVSADSDLCPPVTAVLDRWPQRRVVIAFPPKRTSEHLKRVASAWFRIGRRSVAESQFPDRVIRHDGFVLERPAQWR